MKIKKIALIVLSLVMAFSIVACGKAADNKKTDDNGKDSTTVTATPAEIEKKIADAVGKDNYLCDTEIEKDWLQNSFGIDLSKVDSYVAKQNSVSSVNPDTVIILKTKDGYADEAVKLLNDNFAQMVDYIRQYPFGTAKVMNGRLYQSGNYVVYVIAGASYDGEDTEAEAKLATSEYAKIDKVIKEVFGTLPKNSAVVPEDSGNNGGLIVPDDNNDINNDGAPIVGG